MPVVVASRAGDFSCGVTGQEDYLFAASFELPGQDRMK